MHPVLRSKRRPCAGQCSTQPSSCPLAKRRALVGTRIVDAVDDALDVEENDAATIDEYELALPRLELVDISD